MIKQHVIYSALKKSTQSYEMTMTINFRIHVQYDNPKYDNPTKEGTKKSTEKMGAGKKGTNEKLGKKGTIGKHYIYL